MDSKIDTFTVIGTEPLDTSQLSTIMALEYTDENVVTNLQYIQSSDHEESNCNHCHKPIEVNSKVILRYCDHSFHYKCFIKHHINHPDGKKCPVCSKEFYFTSLEVDGSFDSKIEEVITKLEQVSKAKRIQLHENVIAIPFEADFMRKNKLQYCFVVPMVNCKVGYKKHGSKDIQGLDKGCFGLFVVNRRMRIQAGKDGPRLNLFPVVDHIIGHLKKSFGLVGKDGKEKSGSKEAINKVEIVKADVADPKAKVTKSSSSGKVIKKVESKSNLIQPDAKKAKIDEGTKVAKKESSGKIKKDKDAADDGANEREAAEEEEEKRVEREAEKAAEKKVAAAGGTVSDKKTVIKRNN